MARGLHLLPLLLQLGQHRLKILITFTNQIIRFLQNLLRKTKLAGNRKGVGFARDADQQLIGGTQCLHVKFAGGVDDTGRLHGVEL